jgi:diguanylate cyclase
MASLLDRADAALYASKRAGRNRTTAADPSQAAA